MNSIKKVISASSKVLFVFAILLNIQQVIAQSGSLKLDRNWKMIDDDNVPETGELISQGEYNDNSWYNAVVPGTVLTTLVSERVYPDPYFGTNNQRIPDLANQGKRFWYRLKFDLPDYYRGQKIWLNFDGINYKADIWFNGTHIDDSSNVKGAFRRFIFDISNIVLFTDSNYLAVLIHPNDNPGPTHIRVYDDCGPNGGDLTNDSPTLLCSEGWDWLPTIPDRNMGIWQDVYISASGPVLVRDPHIVTDLPLPSLSPASLTISAELKNVTSEVQKGIIKGEIIGEGIKFERPVTMLASETKEIIFDPASFSVLVINNPRLWWPNGYGKQELYDIKLWFELSDETISDSYQSRFGIREMSYEVPSELVIKVNGEKIMCKGGNWGMDEGMKRIDRKRMHALVRFHRDANYTMIRNWVGQTDDPYFYEFCDEYGLLIWDEFWLPNRNDGNLPNDNELFMKHVEDKIKRYRNHPSIALWCGRNETDPPPALNEAMQELVKALDGTRRYQKQSAAHGVHGSILYNYRDPEFYYGIARGFATEIGLACYPSVESMRKMMPEEDLMPVENNDVWGYHDYCYNSWVKHFSYQENLESRYGDASTIEDVCKKAQLINYEGHKAIYEGWNSKLWNDGSGVLLWMSNPSWYSLVWQIYDYWLEPTGAFFGVKDACEPLHIQMNLNDSSIYIINNKLQVQYDMKADVEVYNMDGTLHWSKSIELDAAKNAYTDCNIHIDYSGVSKVYFIKLILKDATNYVVSENLYWRSTSNDDFTDLQNLSKVNLKNSAYMVRQKVQYADYRILTKLENPSSNIAFSIRLKLLNSISGERVLPAFYEDNYFTLLPGEVKEVTIEFDSRDLEGEKPKLMIEGWNIPTKEINIDLSANFMSNKTTVCYGSNIQFTDVTPDKVYSRNWIFEGGIPSSSTERNPKVSYNTEGSYNVTLTINDENSKTKKDYIKVISSKPKPKFTQNIKGINQGGKIAFTDLSLNNPVTWSWEFSDGIPAISDIKNPKVTYYKDGKFPVTLTVSNECGQNSISKKAVTVNTVKLTADFTSNTTIISCPTEEIVFKDISSGYPKKWEWIFEGGTPPTSNEKNPAVKYVAPDTYNVTLTVSNKSSTDTKTKVDYMSIGQGLLLPFKEGFESKFPPAGWYLNNPDRGITWNRRTDVGNNSASCMVINNVSYTSVGAKDDIILPIVDLSNSKNTVLIFDVAYTIYNDNSPDVLKVFISDDCGSSWQEVYNKSLKELETIEIPRTQSNSWVPEQNNDWRSEVIDLKAYDGKPYIMVKFQNTTAFGTRIWVDNINISSFIE